MGLYTLPSLMGSGNPMRFSPVFFRWLIASLAALGVASRIAPLFNHRGRLLQQWPTEDGYMLLTVARNIALGLGMSTSAGTLPTNGVQPFATFTWSLGYLLVGGDKTLGVLAVLLMEIAIGIATALAIQRLAIKVLPAGAERRSTAMLAAAAWFASTNCIPHTMNCLESGWYALAVTMVASLFVDAGKPGLSIKQILLGGPLLGWAFWVRNDAVFLILAVCLSQLISGLMLGGATVMWRRFRATLVFGTTSVLVAIPWMVSNYRRFGHIMPISGRSESAEGIFGGNLHSIPPVMLENLSLIVPIPNAWQDEALFGAIGMLGCLLGAVITWRMWRRSEHRVRMLILLALIYFVCLVGYYGLFFGANHFIARYFFPMTPFTALWFAVVMRECWLRVARKRALALALPAVAMLILLGTNGRLYWKGKQHEHVQVIDWVLRNVPEDVWVGAPQTGTLGYFHDHTYNLDGKVNADALRARVDETLAQYILEQDIQYIVDWAGVSNWIQKMPLFAQEFEVLVHNQKQNLTVLSRKGARRLTPPRKLARAAMH